MLHYFFGENISHTYQVSQSICDGMGAFLLPKNWTQDSLETTEVCLRCYHHPSIYTICLRVERIHDNQKLSTCWMEIEREWNESISSRNY